MSDPRNPPSGLRISMTEPIRSFLLSASKEVEVPRELQDLALNLSSQNNLHYKSLRSIWIRSPPSTRPPDLIRLFSERNAYAELVKDITPRKNTDEPFSSYKDQIGFGLHVVLIMFTGYLVGYAAFRALFGHSPAMSAAGGILGLVLGMLVETLLFIIRTSETSNPDRRPTTSNTSKLNKNQ
ncbi:hypothetical protein OIU78_014083 [Salix suchowensis]|nr:hypothetical protein OIU78_014083 [Salix suchowensis]